MKKNRGDEPVVVVIHIYKETPCATMFILNNENVISFFFFATKLENRSCGRRERSWERVGGRGDQYQWDGGGGRERG
jgi:hypothetical protein